MTFVPVTPGKISRSWRMVLSSPVLLFATSSSSSWFVEGTLALLLSCSTSWLESWRRVDKFSRLSFSHLHCCTLLLASCILHPFFCCCIFDSPLQNFENYRETRCFLRKRICWVLQSFGNETRQIPICNHVSALLSKLKRNFCIKLWFRDFEWESGIERISNWSPLDDRAILSS